MFIAKVCLLPPGSGEQGQMPFQEYGLCVLVCLFVCLFLTGMLGGLLCLFVCFLNLPGEVSGRKHLLSKLGPWCALAGN